MRFFFVRRWHSVLICVRSVLTMAFFTSNFNSLVLISFYLSSFILLDSASASVIMRRAVINHDAVVGFSQMVPNTTEGLAYLKYKPWLDVPHGCVPFPAVDALGNTG